MILRSLQISAESDAEKKLAELLKAQFNASQIAVKDISGLFWCYVLCYVMKRY